MCSAEKLKSRSLKISHILEIGLLSFVSIDGNIVMKRTFTRDFISLFYGGEMTHKNIKPFFVKVVYMAQIVKNYLFKYVFKAGK